MDDTSVARCARAATAVTAVQTMTQRFERRLSGKWCRSPNVWERKDENGCVMRGGFWCRTRLASAHGRLQNWVKYKKR